MVITLHKCDEDDDDDEDGERDGETKTNKKFENGERKSETFRNNTKHHYERTERLENRMSQRTVLISSNISSITDSFEVNVIFN